MSLDGSPTFIPDDEACFEVDDVYDSLLEAVSNAVLRCIGDAGLVKLKHPVEDYVHCCLERMLNDMVSTSVSQHDNALHPLDDTSSPISCNPGYSSQGAYKAGSSSNKRKTLHEPADSYQKPRSDGAGDLSKKSNSNSQTKTAKVRKTSETVSFSCPFRKRNPQRFNIRDPKRNCATTSFSDLSLLKYEIRIESSCQHIN